MNFKRLLLGLLGTALAGALATLLLLDFERFIIGMYAATCLLTGLFCLTWFPLALRARWRGAKDVSTLAIIDYAGVQVGVFIATAIFTRSFFVYGVTPPRDDVAAVGRVLLALILFSLGFIRLVRWTRALWRSRQANANPDPFEAVGHDGP